MAATGALGDLIGDFGGNFNRDFGKLDSRNTFLVESLQNYFSTIGIKHQNRVCFESCLVDTMSTKKRFLRDFLAATGALGDSKGDFGGK